MLYPVQDDIEEIDTDENVTYRVFYTVVACHPFLVSGHR